MLGMGCRSRRGIAIDERGTVVRGEQPLVRVDPEAVGALDAVELVTGQRAAQRGQAVRAVDVHPQASRRAHVGDPVELVDDTRVRSAAGGHHGEHTVRGVECVVGADRCLQRGAGHPAVIVGVYRQHIDVHHAGSGAYRSVYLLSDSNRVPRRPAAAALGEHLACGHQRAEVRCRAAGYEHAAGALGKPGEIGQPTQGLVLRGDRSGACLPVAAEDRRRADDQIEHRRGHRRRRGHVREVHRVVHRTARRQQHLAEQPQRFQAADAFGSEHVLQLCGELTGRVGAPLGVLG